MVVLVLDYLLLSVLNYNRKYIYIYKDFYILKSNRNKCMLNTKSSSLYLLG